MKFTRLFSDSATGWTGSDQFTRKLSVFITTSAGSVTPNLDVYDRYSFTALAAGLTVNAPIGASIGDWTSLGIRIKDNGTARGITLNAGAFRALGTTLPTTTVANKTTVILAVYNLAALKWDVVAVNQEA